VYALVSVRARLRLRSLGAALIAGALSLGATTSCKGRVSQAECDALLTRFAELVVKEKLKNASPEAIRAELAREREEAARDDNFKNCPTELRQNEYRCAMNATTADALIHCLE
jgi:hypothetical protein